LPDFHAAYDSAISALDFKTHGRASLGKIPSLYCSVHFELWFFRTPPFCHGGSPLSVHSKGCADLLEKLLPVFACLQSLRHSDGDETSRGVGL